VVQYQHTMMKDEQPNMMETTNIAVIFIHRPIVAPLGTICAIQSSSSQMFKNKTKNKNFPWQLFE
jgi:hypothetical protein